jgi:hypothetical protein
MEGVHSKNYIPKNQNNLQFRTKEAIKMHQNIVITEEITNVSTRKYVAKTSETLMYQRKTTN